MPALAPGLFSRQLAYLDPQSIQVDRARRQRQDITFDDLLPSIRERGIMNPLLVEEQSLLLCAGERRLAAALHLGLPEVPIRWVLEHTPWDQLQLIELEENVRRRALSWQDHARAVQTLHKYFLSKDPDWTQGESAQVMAIHPSWLSKSLAVANCLDDPKIAECEHLQTAYLIIQRRESRERGSFLENMLEFGDSLLPVEGEAQLVSSPKELLEQAQVVPEAPGAPVPWVEDPTDEPVPKTTPIQVGSFLEWAPAYSGEKFNFLHCDFPYGLDVFAGQQMGHHTHGHQYDDSPELYWQLVDTTIRHFDRFMQMSCHVMFWLTQRYMEETKRRFLAIPGFEWCPYPLIWHKTDNAGISADHRRHPRHVYETALLGFRAGRNIVRIASDAYGAPTDKRFHVSTKPVPMLRHFMAMLVDHTTQLLDPTCGSGAALRAADSMGAERVFGLEIDPAVGEQALDVLLRERMMRGL